jgi:hypothetical protein
MAGFLSSLLRSAAAARSGARRTGRELEAQDAERASREDDRAEARENRRRDDDRAERVAGATIDYQEAGKRERESQASRNEAEAEKARAEAAYTARNKPRPPAKSSSSSSTTKESASERKARTVREHAASLRTKNPKLTLEEANRMAEQELGYVRGPTIAQQMIDAQAAVDSLKARRNK